MDNYSVRCPDVGEYRVYQVQVSKSGGVGSWGRLTGVGKTSQVLKSKSETVSQKQEGKGVSGRGNNMRVRS